MFLCASRAQHLGPHLSQTGSPRHFGPLDLSVQACFSSISRTTRPGHNAHIGDDVEFVEFTLADHTPASTPLTCNRAITQHPCREHLGQDGLAYAATPVS